MNHDEINFDMRKVFKSLLKEFKESAIRMFSGREFHRRGAACVNDLPPQERLNLDSVRSDFPADRRPGLAET